MYICCDLGGTKSTFAVFDPETNLFSYNESYKASDYADFYELFEDYLKSIQEQKKDLKIEHTTLAVAGRIEKGNRFVVLSNLKEWEIEVDEIESILEEYKYSKSASILNDFQALGYGILLWDEEGTKEEYFENIFGRLKIKRRKKSENEAKISIICGPGTGLGVSCLVNGLMMDGFPYVIASEGGHLTFTPEHELHLKYMRKQDTFRKRSFEEALSGPGLQNMYNHFDAKSFQGLEPKEIVRRANENRDDQSALDTVDFFCEMLAVFCGNMALVFNCDRAIYLWGSTLEDIRTDQLKRRFEDYFANRKHREKLEKIPVVRVINTDLPLYGCANYARYFLERVNENS